MSGSGESKCPGPGAQSEAAAAVTPPPLARGLYIVATPIGNARDITLRALDVLAGANALACEDTRRTLNLMRMHGIAPAGRPVVSYNDRNAPGRRPQVLSWLDQGLSVAYASDAGTPLIADPGYRLVEAARAAGHAVHPIPGPSAVLAALTAAALPTDRFLFLGFLPTRQSARRRVLAEVAAIRATLVLFESPHRLAASVSDIAETLGPTRQAAVLRELTKRHEEVRRGSLGTLAADIAEAVAPKGEIVIIVAPPSGEDAPQASVDEVDRALTEALATSTVSAAARAVAERLGLPRRMVYARALEISGR